MNVHYYVQHTCRACAFIYVGGDTSKSLHNTNHALQKLEQKETVGMQTIFTATPKGVTTVQPDMPLGDCRVTL